MSSHWYPGLYRRLARSVVVFLTEDYKRLKAEGNSHYVTPNLITGLNIFFCLPLFLAFSVNITILNVFGVLILYVQHFLDTLDGEFARLAGLVSKRGEMLDVTLHIMQFGAIFLALGLRGWLFAFPLLFIIVAHSHLTWSFVKINGSLPHIERPFSQLSSTILYFPQIFLKEILLIGFLEPPFMPFIILGLLIYHCIIFFPVMFWTIIRTPTGTLRKWRRRS